MIYYRTHKSERDWKVLDDAIACDLEKIKEWALDRLKDEAFLDSDHGYMAFVEFDDNGKRFYAAAEYASGFAENPGELECWEFGTLEELNAVMDRKITPSKFAPFRSYLKLGVNDISKVWPLKG